MGKADITGFEYQEAIKVLLPTIGPRAEIYTSVCHDGVLYSASLYATGITRNSELNFTVRANTFAALLKAVQDKWAAHSGDHEKRTVRKMALAIIRITAELGACTDAALRNCGEFDAGQIARFGSQACEDANEIAGKGPFTITHAGKANAPSEAA